MMHDPEKSDSSIVAKKPANKPESPGAEPVERREGTDGNTINPPTRRTLCRESVSSGLARVRQAAKARKKERFTALLHHVTVDALKAAYFCLKQNAAPGVDGLTWQDYEQHLEVNLRDLHERIHHGTYRALPSRRAYIAKANGQQRPLGIAALEDKILQRAVAEVLNAIYEEDFLGFSYGFRPRRSQHDALDALAVAITRTKVNWIVDADIAKFFDSVSHEWLIRFLEHRIGDPRILRLIRKWLKAGVMEDGVVSPTEVGSPQGAVVSPLLANVYLHYAFDLWANRWRHRWARGNVVIVRYADDTVVGFEHEADAKRFLAQWQERMAKFVLSLHPDKTRLIEFGRFAAANRARRGLGKPQTFNFLGFTHICGRSRRGDFQLKRKSRRDRMRATLRAVKEKLRRRMHQPIPEQGRWLAQVVRGYFNYHAVPTNIKSLSAFRYHITNLWRRALRRRSQKDRTTWDRIAQLAAAFLPSPHILHPWPNVRFAVTHPRWEPNARIGPVRICAGGLQ
ncbi:MAG: group II intron reverse transcriptase/maturase [Rhodospirillales bacterium]|nr:MAG: group II intron reverse transcriptase/maturase [Rhodospirillales bacterium]